LAPTDWFLDGEGTFRFDQRVEGSGDVPTGGTYIGESFAVKTGDETLYFGEGGGVFNSIPMEGAVVYGEPATSSGMTRSEEAATGFPGASGVASKTKTTLSLAGETAGKLKPGVRALSRALTGGALVLSSGSEFFQKDGFGTYEQVKLGADVALTGLSFFGGLGGTAVAFGADVSGGKQAAVEAIARGIVEAESAQALRNQLRIGQY
jgi:hypothetical protein